MGQGRPGMGMGFGVFFRAWVVWSQTRGGCLWWIGTAIGEVLEAVGQLVGLSMQCRVIAMSIHFLPFRRFCSVTNLFFRICRNGRQHDKKEEVIEMALHAACPFR